MDVFNWQLYGNSLLRWLYALVLVVALSGIFRALVGLIHRRLEQVARRTRSAMDDLLLDLLDRTKFLFLVLVSIYIGALGLALPEAAQTFLNGALTVALLIQAGFWGMGVLDYLISTRIRQEELEQDAAGKTTISALGYVARVILWAVVLLMILENAGVEVTALIASLGIGGIAVALALQNILGDLFASLAIVLDKPFVIGDFIIVNEFLGTVEHIGLKTTRIRSLSGEQIVFSNSDLLNSRIRNYKRMFERRVVFGFGVVYQTPAERLAQISEWVRDIIESLDSTRFDRAHFKSFGDSSLDFEVVYYVLEPDYNVYMDIQEEINLALYRRFDAEAVEFAYPTRTVYVSQTDEVERTVDRERQTAAGGSGGRDQGG